ncbi:hypothetical protein FOVSG1_001459 [Fusarium oxysporum f. sp. vasinfectum]
MTHGLAHSDKEPLNCFSDCRAPRPDHLTGQHLQTATNNTGLGLALYLALTIVNGRLEVLHSVPTISTPSNPERLPPTLRLTTFIFPTIPYLASTPSGILSVAALESSLTWHSLFIYELQIAHTLYSPNSTATLSVWPVQA